MKTIKKLVKDGVEYVFPGAEEDNDPNLIDNGFVNDEA